MRSKRWFPVVLMALFVGTVIDWPCLERSKETGISDGKGDFRDITSTVAATGNVNAVVTVQARSQVSGNIKALDADFNTKVSKSLRSILKSFRHASIQLEPVLMLHEHRWSTRRPQ